MENGAILGELENGAIRGEPDNGARLGEPDNGARRGEGIGDRFAIDNVPGLGTANGTTDLDGPDDTIGRVPERMLGNLFTDVILGDGGKRFKFDNDD